MSKVYKKILKEAQHNGTDTLKQLIKDDKSFNWTRISYPQTGDTLLHIAAQLAYVDIIKLLLELYPDAVDIKNKDDKTPLHDAAQFGQLASVLLLCSLGANVNALKRGDWTPLMLSCTKNHNLEIVKCLVENGAKLNVLNKDGWSVCHILARCGNVDIFNYLLEHGLNTNVRTKNGRTALHVAALHGHQGMVRRLLEYIDCVDGCGNTAFHESILGGHIEVAELLVENGANYRAKNNSDMNALHLAASHRNLQTIGYVLNNLQFNINERNSNGWTAAHCAARKGLKDVVEYLGSQGADLTITDNFGRTILNYDQ